MRNSLPGTITTLKIARALGVSVEELITGKLETHHIDDPLYELLSNNGELKSFVWRVAHCSSDQIRAMEVLLSTWGVSTYSYQGEKLKSIV